MDALFEFLNDIAGGDSTLVVSLFVFLSAAALAFGVMAVIQVRPSGSVMRLINPHSISSDVIVIRFSRFQSLPNTQRLRCTNGV